MQQVRHRLKVFIRRLVGGYRREFGGDAGQADIRAPAAKGAGRFIADAAHQRQAERPGKPLPQRAVAGVFNTGQRIVKRNHPRGMDLVDQLAQRTGFRF